MQGMNDLIDALLDGDKNRAVAEASDLVANGASPDSIVLMGIEPAMNRLDALCRPFSI